jgi:hypothetical protein
MQIVVEGLALFSFRRMRSMTEEPLLKDLLAYVSRDESRHHAYGVQYIERCVPCLSVGEREDLEDFAFDAAQILAGSQSNRGLLEAFVRAWADSGVDVVELMLCVQREQDEISRGMTRTQQLGPVTGFVIPTLKRCGLLSPRLAARFHELLKPTQGARLVGETVDEFVALIPGLPTDTAAWVLNEIN